MTDQFKVFTDQQKQLLDQPLDQRLISERKGGSSTMLKYIEGHDAIDQANRIFGHGNWGSRPLFCEPHILRDPLTDQPVGVTYKAQVELIVRGCVTPIVEVGSQPVATWNLKDYLDGRRKKGDARPIEEWEKTLGARIITEAHEMAEKGAVTDALKRALRTFGNQFGNGLYGDGQVQFDDSDTGASSSSSKAQTSPPAPTTPSPVTPPVTRPTPVPTPQREEPKKMKLATSEQIADIADAAHILGPFEWRHLLPITRLPDDTSQWNYEQATIFLKRVSDWTGSDTQKAWLAGKADKAQMDEITRFRSKEQYGGNAVASLKSRISEIKDVSSTDFTHEQADILLNYLYTAKPTIEQAKRVDPQNKVVADFKGITHPLDFYAAERSIEEGTLEDYLKRLGEMQAQQAA